MLRIVTVRNSSCGKVMFSEVSAHRGGGVHPPFARHTPSPNPDGYYSGRYASYCNAFLFKCCFSWPVNSAMRCFHLASRRDTSSTTRTHHDFAVGFWFVCFLPPATKLRQGNVFTPVCHSVHGGEWQHPPRSSACWEIRATIGRHAPAYLFVFLQPLTIAAEFQSTCTARF